MNLMYGFSDLFVKTEIGIKVFGLNILVCFQWYDIENNLPQS